MKSGPARGRLAIGLVLSFTLTLALYSATSGFVDAVAFVRGEKSGLKPIAGPLGSYANLAPSGTGYGFYAPQVCSEFRLKMRLGNSKTREIKDLALRLGAETSMLATTLSTTAQDEEAAKLVAETFASYAFTAHPAFDAAEVRLEFEKMPLLHEAGRVKPEWRTLATFYFKR